MKQQVLIQVVLVYDSEFVGPPGKKEIMELFEPAEPGLPENIIPFHVIVTDPQPYFGPDLA